MDNGGAYQQPALHRPAGTPAQFNPASYGPPPVMPVEPSNPSPGKIDIRQSIHEVIEVIQRGKWMILAATLIVLTLVVLYTATIEEEYSSYSVVLIEKPKEESRIDNALALGYLGDTRLTQQDRKMEAMLLSQSLLIAERTIERLADVGVVPGTNQSLKVLQQPEPENGMQSKIKGLFGGESEEARHLTNTDLAVRLQERYVHIGSDGSAIRLTSNANTAAEAALIANFYAEEYVKRTRETGRARIAASRVFLEEQMEERASELNQLERQIQGYLSREDAVALDQGSQLTVAKYVEIESQRDQALVDLRTREAGLEALEAELAGITPNLASRVAAGSEAEIQRRQEEIARLENIVGQIYRRNPELRERRSNDPDLARLQQQIADQKAEVERLTQRYTSETLAGGGDGTQGGDMAYAAQLRRKISAERIALNGIRAQVQALGGTLDDYGTRLERIPRQSMRLAQLERDRQSAERRFAFMQNALEEVRLAEEAEIGLARIIRPALAPEDPVSPNKARNYFMGLMLGLMLGLLGAVVRYKMDPRIYSPEDIKTHDLGILGVIPDLMPIIEEDFGGESKYVIRDRAFSTTLIPFLNPLSSAADTYRRLFINLQLTLPQQGGRTVLITSSEPEAGKSTTALNLAITAAMSGQRTVIVDGDLYNPTIHRYLGWASGRSLVDLAARRGHFNSIELETGIENLYAVTSTQPVRHAPKVLGSPEMRELIARLKAQFDVVIIDSPPTLLRTDAMLLTMHCDATVVVVSAGGTDSGAHQYVVDELRGAGGRVVGTVLNKFTPRGIAGSKYGYGKYGYGRYGYRGKLNAA